MQTADVEVLRIGPDLRLFQISDGERYGIVEIAEESPPLPFKRPSRLRDPTVQAYLGAWLEREGVLVGTPHPPRLHWEDVCCRVPRAGTP